MTRRRNLEHQELREQRAAQFATALASALDELKLTHQHLARELSVPRYTVDSWTRVQGPKLPSDANVEKLAYLLEGFQPGLGRRLAALASGDSLSTPSNPSVLTNHKRAFASSFIGRENEIEITQNLLRDHRLVTLTGPGGIGKTRLALRVATEIVVEFPDGVSLVELAELTDPSLVPQAVALVLRVREQKKDQLLAALIEHLREKKTLLVLDNCEHLLKASHGLAQSLLAACPSLHILATSREPLELQDEVVARVPPMNMPESTRPTLPELMKHEATRLFIDRAFLQRQHIALTPHNSAAITEVCRRLDGIPLAIELSAACTLVMQVEDIAARLNDRFLLLTRGGETVMSRHLTLRAAIDWSHELLSPPERVLLRRLAVFAGGWTLQSAEKVTRDSEKDTRPTLERLVEKSLVIAEEGQEGMRYRMLETIREYSREQLITSGEMESSQQRHATYYLALAERVSPLLREADQVKWLNELEIEHNNFRAALAWTLENQQAEPALRLSGALWRFWYARGYLSEGRQWLASALQSKAKGTASRPLTTARAKALNAASSLAYIQGDYSQANIFSQESVSLQRELGDSQGVALSLNTLGLINMQKGDYPLSKSLFEESLALREELGDWRGIAASLNNLGGVARLEGNYAHSQILLEKAIALLRELGDKRGTAISLEGLGLAALYRGDYERARILLEEHLALASELGDRLVVAYAHRHLGLLERHLGNYLRAAELFKQGLIVHYELWNRRGVAECVEGLAGVADAEGQPTKATGLLAAATGLRDTIGTLLPVAERTDYDRIIAHVRHALEKSSFDAAWEHGHAMALKQIVQYALEESHETK